MTDEEFLQGIGAAVKQHREAKRFSMRHLCDLLKCGSSQFWKIEHGKGWVGVRMLKRIADALGVPVISLIPIPALAKNPFGPIEGHENPEPTPDAHR